MYGNNIVNFEESTTILNACTKIVWKLIEGTTYFRLFQLTILMQQTRFFLLKSMQQGQISILNGGSLKLMDKFT